MVGYGPHFGQLPALFGHPVVPVSRPLHNSSAILIQLCAQQSAQEIVHRGGRPCSARCEALLLECRKVDQVH